MATELKPCPFCGRKDIRMLTTAFDCTIFCGDCKVSMRRENRINRGATSETLKEAQPEAIKAWNRRAEDGKT